MKKAKKGKLDLNLDLALEEVARKLRPVASGRPPKEGTHGKTCTNTFGGGCVC